MLQGNIYLRDAQKCLDALWVFLGDVNDYLPDTPNGDDYYYEWTLESCEYIQDCINRTIYSILSTCMRDHVTYELSEIQNAYNAALKDKDVRRCQRLLNKAMKEFAIIHTVCKQIKKSEVK